MADSAVIIDYSSSGAAIAELLEQWVALNTGQCVVLKTEPPQYMVVYPTEPYGVITSPYSAIGQMHIEQALRHFVGERGATWTVSKIYYDKSIFTAHLYLEVTNGPIMVCHCGYSPAHAMLWLYLNWRAQHDLAGTKD
jgi:hypothetical protein